MLKRSRTYGCTALKVWSSSWQCRHDGSLLVKQRHHAPATISTVHVGGTRDLLDKDYLKSKWMRESLKWTRASEHTAAAFRTLQTSRRRRRSRAFGPVESVRRISCDAEMTADSGTHSIGESRIMSCQSNMRDMTKSDATVWSELRLCNKNRRCDNLFRVLSCHPMHVEIARRIQVFDHRRQSATVPSAMTEPHVNRYA